jgi:methionyl-tRNA formyltransferase
MRVIFMGTPETAVPPLKKLLDHSYEVAAVFTQPDRPSGRGHKLQPSPVKIFARENGLRVFQPEKIRDQESREIFDNLQPDFIVVAAYGQILPSWVLESARLAPLNIHFSLLPMYRGAAPVARAILNGDAITGTTIMIMQSELDAGPILKQAELSITPTATTGEIEAELSETGSELLIETMQAYAANTVHPVRQEEEKVTWAARIVKEDARIDWNENANRIHNRIRAMNPRPGAFTFFRRQQVHIWSSLPESEKPDSPGFPGEFLGIDKGNLRIQCGEGSVLQILELQKPSKRRINGREFASGVHWAGSELLFENPTEPK